MDFEEILSKMKPEHAEVIHGIINAKDADLSKAREDLGVAQQSLADTESKLNAANEELAKANTEIEALKAKDAVCECDGEADEDGKCKSCGKPKKKSAAFDETETLKSMPESARAMFLKMRAQNHGILQARVLEWVAISFSNA